MPLVYQQNINEYTRLGVWHITEQEDFFTQEPVLLPTITHPLKRKQHLAGRYLLKVLFESFPLHLIESGSPKKPFLKDHSFHFSIAHSGEYAAVIVSKKMQVGIDIEFPKEKILQISPKFLSEEDLLCLKTMSVSIVDLLTLGWCVKETVFKWHGQPEVDFKKHILLRSISQEASFYNITCDFVKNQPITLSVNGFYLNGFFLTWLVQ